jgi:hypothetical protein
LQIKIIDKENNEIITNVYIKDSTVRIPEVFWKVVYERGTGSGLIFITFNNPKPVTSSNFYRGLENAVIDGVCSDCKNLWANIKGVTILNDKDIYGKTFCCNSIKEVLGIFNLDNACGVNELSYLPQEVQESNTGIQYPQRNLVSSSTLPSASNHRGRKRYRQSGEK